MFKNNKIKHPVTCIDVHLNPALIKEWLDNKSPKVVRQAFQSLGSISFEIQILTISKDLQFFFHCHEGRHSHSIGANFFHQDIEFELFVDDGLLSLLANRNCIARIPIQPMINIIETGKSNSEGLNLESDGVYIDQTFSTRDIIFRNRLFQIQYSPITHKSEFYDKEFFSSALTL